MLAWTLAVLMMAGQSAQANTGERHVIVTDAAGLPLAGAVEIASESNQIHQRLDTDPDGGVVAKRLPFGAYRVLIELASSEAAGALGENVVRLPVPPSRGNFYEAGMSTLSSAACGSAGAGSSAREIAAPRSAGPGGCPQHDEPRRCDQFRRPFLGHRARGAADHFGRTSAAISITSRA